MGKNPPKWLPGDRVKETILLQRKSVEQLRADRVLRRDKLQERRDRHKAKLDAKRKRKLTSQKFQTAQSILKHAQRKEHQSHRFRKIGERVDGRRTRSDPKNFAAFLKDNKAILIVRAKGKQVPPEVAAAFRELGLSKLYAARLLCATPRSLRLVKQLTPFSIIGHPSKAQLEELLRTRGALLDAETKEKHFISGNLMLEKALGAFNVLCIEDLVDLVVTKGEHVEKVLRAVAPFDFHPPRQLFVERHRSVHAKLEKVNQESFTAYLEKELKHTEKVDRREKRRRSASSAPSDSAPRKKAARKE